MTREEFDRLVDAVERGVGRDPAALRRRTLWLALIGYVGLLAWLLCIVAIAAVFFSGLVWADATGRIVCGVAGTLVLFGGGALAVRALLPKIRAPEGRAVTRTEAPALFAVLDELAVRLRCPPFHTVMLTAECNASVVHVPRLGALGWSRDYLLLGLPLLDSLSRDEARAVLAHEFAHLSRAHGRFSHWLYRLRRSWDHVFQQLAQPRPRSEISLRPLTTKFVDWFWPRFNAHAFVLSRANEYEADAQAAAITGHGPIATSLVRLRVVDRMLDKNFWPDFWSLATTQPEPPDNMLEQLQAALRRGTSPVEAEQWIAEALRTATTNADTHPCLRERLHALGTAPVPPAETLAHAAAPSAAEIFLGDRLASLRRDVQRRWRDDIKPDWRQRHARTAALGHRLASLEQAVPLPANAADALWDKALVLFDLRDDRAVEPLLRELLALRPDHAPANLQLGRILLEAGNTDGEALVERAMTLNDEFVPAACAILQNHFRRTGNVERLRALSARQDRHEKELEASRTERSSLSARDSLIAHGLAAAELDALRQTLAREPRLARAELAQKQLRHSPTQRFFALCVHRTPAWHRWPNGDEDRALARRLAQAVQLPGRVLVFPPSGDFRALARKLKKIPGAEIWP